VGGAVLKKATWKAVTTGPHEIDLVLVSSNGLPGALKSAAKNIKIPLSQLPLGLHLTGGLNSSSTGLSVAVGAQSISFGG